MVGTNHAGPTRTIVRRGSLLSLVRCCARADAGFGWTPIRRAPS